VKSLQKDFPHAISIIDALNNKLKEDIENLLSIDSEFPDKLAIQFSDWRRDLRRLDPSRIDDSEFSDILRKRQENNTIKEFRESYPSYLIYQHLPLNKHVEDFNSKKREIESKYVLLSHLANVDHPHIYKYINTIHKELTN